LGLQPSHRGAITIYRQCLARQAGHGAISVQGLGLRGSARFGLADAGRPTTLLPIARLHAAESAAGAPVVAVSLSRARRLLTADDLDSGPAPAGIALVR